MSKKNKKTCEEQIKDKTEELELKIKFLQQQVDYADTAYSCEFGAPLDWSDFFNQLDNNNNNNNNEQLLF
jgi:hypothetical protein